MQDPATTKTAPDADYPAMVAAWVAETIPQLESAALNGTLTDLIDQPDVQEVIGPGLLEEYRRIAVEKPKLDPVFRRDWTSRFVQVFQQSLQIPRQIFPAKIASSRTKVNSQQIPALEVPHETGVAILRPDQALSARYWGIWFQFDNEVVEGLYLNALVSSAHYLLVSSIQSLRRTQQLIPGGSVYDKVCASIDSEVSSSWEQEVAFAHLIMDVLNEFAPLAAPLVPAGLVLSLNCPENKSLSGSRLQISLATVSKVQPQASPSGASSFSLSPFELASCAMHPGLRLQLADFAWKQLCGSVVGELQDVELLAQALRGRFIDTLSAETIHPLGPLWHLSGEVRRFIHAFVGLEPPKALNCMPGLHVSAAERVDLMQRWKTQCDALRRRFPSVELPPETRSPQEYLHLAMASVKEVIHQLEEGIHNESLVELILKEDVPNIIGEVLATRYRNIALSKMRHDVAFRKNWIGKFIATFEAWLQSPSKLFVSKAASKQPWLEQLALPSLSVSHSEGVTTLRPDQALSARRWGIWFTFDEELLESHYTAFLIGMALQELDSNIGNLWNLEATYLSGNSNLTTEAEWRSEKRGVDFEHLIIDVLNEPARVARRAPLAEDILERTDVRVKFPGLKRNNGARVQVSLAAAPLVHDSKMRSLLVPEEFVMLTPLELARCAVHPPTHRLFEEFDWNQFWVPLGGRRRDVHGLAQELHDMFVEALYRPLSHPFGPMWILPSPIRQFIRVFTEHGAAKTTERVRKRIETSGRPMDAVRKYTRNFWKERLSQPSPAAPTAEFDPAPDEQKNIPS